MNKDNTQWRVKPFRLDTGTYIQVHKRKGTLSFESSIFHLYDEKLEHEHGYTSTSEDDLLKLLNLPECAQTWTRFDKRAKTYRTTSSSGLLWENAVARITLDDKAGHIMSLEYTKHMTGKDLHRNTLCAHGCVVFDGDSVFCLRNTGARAGPATVWALSTQDNRGPHGRNRSPSPCSQKFFKGCGWVGSLCGSAHPLSPNGRMCALNSLLPPFPTNPLSQHRNLPSVRDIRTMLLHVSPVTRNQQLTQSFQTVAAPPVDETTQQTSQTQTAVQDELSIGSERPGVTAKDLFKSLIWSAVSLDDAVVKAILEQMWGSTSLSRGGLFSELKEQFHSGRAPGCQWGSLADGMLSSKSWFFICSHRRWSSRRCLHDHSDQTLEKETLRYTPQLVKTIAKEIMKMESLGGSSCVNDYPVIFLDMRHLRTVQM